MKPKAMLPADQLELITAAVDGELSATQTLAFQKLLDSSPEARVLFAQLTNDSARVRSMPQATPPAGLEAKILARIASATPAPRPKPRPVAPPKQPALVLESAPSRRMPAWVPAALAASLLLSVTAGSFAFFNAQTSAKNQTAKNQWLNSLPAPQEAATAIPAPNSTAPNEQPRPDPSSVVKSEVSPVPPLPMPKVVPPAAIVVAPEPRPVTPDFLTSPVLPKIPPFDLIQIRTPFLRTVAELDREDIRQELLDELQHEQATVPFRIDLFVRDTARGVEVFQNAAKATGLTVFADAATLDKLKRKHVHAVVIYTEALTPAELTAFSAQIATEDAKFSPRVCDSLHALPVATTDVKELREILGLDVGLFKRTGGSGTGQGGDRGEKGDKPVSAGTIDAVTKALTSPPAKPGEKPAVLMTWQAVPGVARTVPGASAELKQFLVKRGDRKPGVVPAIIVIRPVG